MNTTEQRMQLLENAFSAITTYTTLESDWRPGLVDLCVYDSLISMHESDEDPINPEYFWNKTPDEIMQDILDKGERFTLDYGWDSLTEQVRDYLACWDLTEHVDELTEEEVEQRMENMNG